MEKSSANGTGSTHPSVTEIISILDEQAKGWNEGDAKTYSKAFSENGCFTNIFGMFHVGYTEFLRKHDMILKGVFSGSVFRYRLVQLKFINDDVSVAETLITVSDFNKSGPFNQIHTDSEGRMFTRLVQVFAKEKDTWKIISYHNVDIKNGVSIPELL